VGVKDVNPGSRSEEKSEVLTIAWAEVKVLVNSCFLQGEERGAHYCLGR